MGQTYCNVIVGILNSTVFFVVIEWYVFCIACSTKSKVSDYSGGEILQLEPLRGETSYLRNIRIITLKKMEHVVIVVILSTERETYDVSVR